MNKTWVLDGGPKRFIAVAVIAVSIIGVVVCVVGIVYFQKLSGYAANSAAVNDFGAPATSATGSAADDQDVTRPDPLGAARDGASRWLAGDFSSLSPEATATAPTAPQGASLADGGEVLADGDGYSAVSVPLLVNNANATLTVEMSWNGDRWQIISLLVS